MPKFGLEKKADVARESEAKTRVEKSRREAKVDAAADKKVRAPFADGNASESNAVEKTPVATARKARSSGWVSQWGSKLSSLVSQKPKPTRSAIPQFKGHNATDGAGVPVQGELSLDNIKVVRNDLSDADLEVVTRKMAPVKEAEVGRASPRADEVAKLLGLSAARGDARPTISEMVEAVKS